MEIVKKQVEVLNGEIQLLKEEQKAKLREWLVRLNIIKEKLQYVENEYMKRNNLHDADDIVRTIDDSISRIESFTINV